MLNQQGISIAEFGKLLVDVQLQRVFADQKTFVDSIPKRPLPDILGAYSKEKGVNGFDLERFVRKHFALPTPDQKTECHDANSPAAYVECLWDSLVRTELDGTGTLIPLPHRYVVPGGRFQELFYWDSYFTMLGLEASGRIDLVSDMVANFAYLIDIFGFIPNGTRSYFLSRSQPPFFVLMVGLLGSIFGENAYLRFLPQLEREYAFWMDGVETLGKSPRVAKRVVRLPAGGVLNRYWDGQDTPRPESYFEDVQVAKEASIPSSQLFTHLRAACESGWDFSSRWLVGGTRLSDIRTADILPIDLNVLLCHLEKCIAKGHGMAGNPKQAARYRYLAKRRKQAIQQYLWDEESGTYRDFNHVSQVRTEALSMAMAFPLFLNIAPKKQATRVLQYISQHLLKTGGLVTTTVDSGQQWDAPNGWAPLQWVGYIAAKQYGDERLAREIRQRWLHTVDKGYTMSGKMMEKYNVVCPDSHAQAGEYPNQDGFGWTNGVYLRFLLDETTHKQ